MPRHIATIAIKIQPILARQSRNKFLISLRLRTTQPVIEMNNRKDYPQFPPQLQQQPQERNRIDSPGHSNAHPITSTQQRLRSNVRQHPLSKGMHGTMVPQE
jgi:hypothetical protein